LTAVPTSSVIESKLACKSSPATGHPLALVQRSDGSSPALVVLDVANPLAPAEACELAPAAGGRFLSATKVAFWLGRQLAVADLLAGSVTATGTVVAAPSEGAFSPDGTQFAYHVGGDTGGISTHLFGAGKDRTLLARPGIGGHGGPPYGPTSQLRFSSDGNYLLAVDSLFADFGSGPPNFLVYGSDGAIVFQSDSAEFGVWSRQGDSLYYLASKPAGDIRGDIRSWDPYYGDRILFPGLSTYTWPSIARHGSAIVFDAYDVSSPSEATGGLPHLSRLDLASGAVTQLSRSASSRTAVIGGNVVWTDQESPCSCGPAGASAPTGKVLAYDLVTRRETLLDLRRFTSSPIPASAVLDAWSA
jgi:hypothetical protein